MYIVLAILAFLFLGYLLHTVLKHQKAIMQIQSSMYLLIGAVAQQEQALKHCIESVDNILDADNNGKEA